MKLRKALYSVLCLAIGGWMLSSCIEEYEADISAGDSGLLVVEGTICSAQLNKFSLSLTKALNSPDTPQKVTGAKVSVRGDDGSEYPTQEANGYYTREVLFAYRG